MRFYGHLHRPSGYKIIGPFTSLEETLKALAEESKDILECYRSITIKDV